MKRIDSRDLHFHEKFGSTTEFPTESNFSVGVPEDIEGMGEVDCTAESTCKVATSQTKIVYDHEELWSRVPKTSMGADPRDTLGAMISGGLQPLDGTLPKDTRWPSYWRADTLPGVDKFDSTRSAMTLANSSCTVASPWYSNWGVLPGGTLPMPNGVISTYHDYVIKDWKLDNGETKFLIDAHLGYDIYMTREVFNAAISTRGSGAYMPSTAEIDARRKRTLMQYLIDVLQNLVFLYQQLLVAKK